LSAPLDLTVPLLDLPPPLAAQAHGPEQDPNNPLFRQVGENYLKGGCGPTPMSRAVLTPI
jgi:isopenicillin N synthase-like dioxygenase